MSSSPEQLNQNQENSIEAPSSAVNQLEKIRNRSENSVELSPRDAEAQVEKARHEALESAISVESSGSERNKNKAHTVPSRHGQINKKTREASFSRTMEHVQDELPTANRLFSKFIHNKVVEKTSEVAGNTIARPNSILYGAFFAFIFTLTTYIVAKTIGYRLSGSETILAFIAGWLFGIIYDYLHILFTGKK